VWILSAFFHKEQDYMKNLTKKGFTLIELMIVVAIVGILAVLAVFGVRKYITNAKSAEARNAIGAIAKRAGQALERETSDTTVIAGGSSSTANSRRLCGTSTKVPGTAPANKKYQSSASDWNAGDTSTSWSCLKFSMNEPQYYAYQYQATGTTGGVGDTATITAEGDLNGDTVTSKFSLNGAIQSGGNLTFAPSIAEVNPDE
jgi:type IV pilus assembly protein PilA